MAKYNGHKNWNHWNVSLWINNDEYLYNLARKMCVRVGKEQAAVELLDYLPERTPDGASYTKTSVRAALVDF